MRRIRGILWKEETCPCQIQRAVRRGHDSVWQTTTARARVMGGDSAIAGVEKLEIVKPATMAGHILPVLTDERNGWETC